MGLLFEKSEKKVANTLTFVQLIRKHDAEIEALMKENRKKTIEAEKAKKAKYLVNSRIGNLRASLKNKPNPEKEIELKIYLEVQEALK